MKHGLRYIPESFVSSDTLKVYDMVSNMELYIPHHQRDFSWEKEEVEQFLSDIENLMQQDFEDDKSIAHFIGAMVFIKNEKKNRFEIIDGQQRLTTTMLFFAMLKLMSHHIQDRGKQYTLYSRIHSYIFSSLAGQDNETRLKLDREQKFFEKVLSINTIEELDEHYNSIHKKKDVTTTIYNRSKQIYNHFRVKLAPSFDSEQALYSTILKYIESIQSMMVCIKITVQHPGVAYNVFETLNARGKGLSKADLIKNTLLSYSEKQHSFDSVHTTWSDVIEELTQYDNIEITDFLTTSYYSRIGKLDNGNLFDSIKGLLESNTISAKEYANIINEDYRSYLKTKMLDTTEDSYFSLSVLTHIKDLNKYIKVARSYPLIIAGRNYLNKEDFEKLVESISNFTFRYKVVLNKSADTLLTLVINWSKNLREKSKSVDEIISEMKDNALDGEFRSSFETFAPGTQYQRFYVIKKIEDYLSNGAGVTVLNQSYSQHLEHIMPQTPNQKEWSHIFDEKHC